MIHLDSAYNRQDLVDFLENKFLPYDYEPSECVDPLGAHNSITQITNLGKVSRSLDGLQVLEVLHSSRSDARVTLSREIFRYMQNNQITYALVAFVPNDDSSVWRLSFIKMSPKINSKGALEWENTSPKRYSFLLGVGQHVKTPIQTLIDKGKVTDIADLENRFSIETLTKDFYNELFDWYQWAQTDEINVHYPNKPEDLKDDRDDLAEHIIRLITRLMFVWFIKKKGFIPDVIFDENTLKSDILTDFDPYSATEGNYYNAVLQNLFFASLNREITKREFASDGGDRNNQHYGIKTLFRDNRTKSFFKITHAEVIDLFKPVPFLNGGLFECLDKDGQDGAKIIYYDGFSRENLSQKRAFIPNCLFFSPEKEVKLQDNKKHTVSGIINIFRKYNFTVEENTPSDVDVALDPELLGKVFENLLATYNPETGETARKNSGSFYTPREIVNCMVDESLNNYLNTIVGPDYEKKPEETIKAIKNIKVLDPACGSGAFPMGMLLALINKLTEIKPDLNVYKTKLELIQNCIYGIDIQPIAVQITKLRFFISLICEEFEYNDDPEQNYGINILPNLETKFVAANSLIGISGQETFNSDAIKETKEKLTDLRYSNFSKTTAKEKHELRKKDKELRDKLKEQLQDIQGLAAEEIHNMAEWNPYDQNTSSKFFDSVWMFGPELKDGFDIVIGNPPYVSNKKTDPVYADVYGFSDDLYNYFFIKSMELCKKDTGILAFITSNTFLTLESKHNVRDLLQKYKLLLLNDLGAGVFLGAVVSTVISIVKKTVMETDYHFKYIDSRDNFEEPDEYDVNVELFKKAINSVFFAPNKENMKIYNKYMATLKSIYKKYWPMISTSRNIAQNTRSIEEYRNQLKPGDITLLGVLTDGGVGLQTGNNGKYVAVMDGTRFADNIRDSRPTKLRQAYQKFKISELSDITDFSEFLTSKTEVEIADLFDSLKEKYDRDIFGQGYLFKIITKKDVANPDDLTQEEKYNGIDASKPHYVVYDKGDKDGNRWYLESPYYISWTKENVHLLQTDPKARWQGYNFFFKEGFCWTNVLMPTNEESKYIKCRLKGKSVNDVASMSLYNKYNMTSVLYFVALLNSRFMYNYLKEFINNTVNLQINDFRQLPIIIPSEEQLNQLNDITKRAITIKQSVYSSGQDVEKQQNLADLQQELEDCVRKLYDL